MRAVLTMRSRGCLDDSQEHSTLPAARAAAARYADDHQLRRCRTSLLLLRWRAVRPVRRRRPLCPGNYLLLARRGPDSDLPRRRPMAGGAPRRCCGYRTIWHGPEERPVRVRKAWPDGRRLLPEGATQPALRTDSPAEHAEDPRQRCGGLRRRATVVSLRCRRELGCLRNGV